MPDKDLFEYAVIRIVPRVEREEFINVGVVVFCARQRFLQATVCLDAGRLAALCPLADSAVIAENLQAFIRICDGGKGSGPIGQLDAASRFRWLTAMRSTVVQTSRVHPGFCSNAGVTLEKLCDELVR